VQLDVKEYGRPGKRMSGKVVSPSSPREDDGTYWGYQTRMADSLHKVFEECPFDGGYDVKIGTSERGDVSIDDKGISVPQFRHSLIVFGGVAGIEECVDADESHTLPGSQSKKLFDMWYVKQYFRLLVLSPAVVTVVYRLVTKHDGNWTSSWYLAG